MSSNDGQKLLVFGLSFAQQDNRKMQQVLRHYNRLPSSPGSRAALFVELNNLAKELMADEAAQVQIQQLTDWMRNGGESPLQAAHSGMGGSVTSAGGEGAETHRTSSGLSGGHHYIFGRGRTLNDPPEADNQDASSSESLTNNDNHNDAHNTDHVPLRTNMERYGRGRTIDDSPETVNAGGNGEAMGDSNNQSDNFEMQDWNDDWELGTRVGQNYGYGRTLNDLLERDVLHRTGATNNDGDGIRGRNGYMEEDANAFNPSNTTDSENEEARPPITNESSGSSNVSSMHPKETHDAEETECPICLEEYLPSNFPKTPTITELCDHPDKACLQCLNSSIATMVERGALHLLACPICPQKLSPKDIKKYSNKEVYKRYEYLKQQSEIPGHWISCTNTDCGGSQPHESEDPMMVCNHCKFATCAKHKRPWHEGQTCGEFDQDDAQIERLEEEEATAKLLAKEATSICPQCGQGVTKTEGCDHMQCQCGQEWCYICSCSWENILRIGDTAHATFCIYHPNKVNLTQAQQEATRNRIMGLVHGGEISAELAKARDELRQRRRVEIRAKAAEAAEARLKGAVHQKRIAITSPEKKKKKVKLVAPWEEGGRTKKSL
ncbi:E3 ubiquitin-protein ligase RNF19B [Cytospora mali]|uniref:RBR-type E3 ubiquitin transferase n=1 Tax=Cytospora mali TaxID=578113 RepID=A0A194VVF1_CYTMA|nr:E3 ubiquitin-protein ligase RNF19B [Valsa mali]